MTSVYDRALESVSDEVARGIDRELRTSGSLPPDLRGTLLRNGPGLLAMGKDPLNFFDAHGLIVALQLGDGAPRMRARVTETPALIEERSAGRVTRRRLFTNHPSRWKNLASVDIGAGNACAHDALMFQGHILATNDPYTLRLDPSSLAVLGRETFGGVVKRGDNVSPMPRFDPRSGALLGYTVAPGKSKPDVLTFFELDDAGKVAQTGPSLTLSSSPAIVHQQAFSARHLVVAELPARLSVKSALWGSETLYQAFRWPAGKGTELLVARRGTSGSGAGDVVRIPTSLSVIFHLPNAFDDGERLVVDAIGYEDPVPFSLVAAPSLRPHAASWESRGSSPPHLIRLVIDPVRGKLIEQTLIVETPAEAPDIDRRFLGERTRFVFAPMGGHNQSAPAPGFYGWFHGIGRIDVDTRTVAAWSAGPEQLCSPPAFAPRPGSTREGDGWLLVWVIGPSETEVAILDAQHVERGPLATLHLGVHLPALSHTSFWPAP